MVPFLIFCHILCLCCVYKLDGMARIVFTIKFSSVAWLYCDPICLYYVYKACGQWVLAQSAQVDTWENTQWTQASIIMEKLCWTLICVGPACRGAMRFRETENPLWFYGNNEVNLVQVV